MRKAMDQSVRDKLCTGLIVDFVNATTSEEAGLKFIVDIQRFFNFPPHLLSDSQKKFPEVKNFLDELSSSEKDLFQLFRKEMQSLEIMERHSGHLSFHGYGDDLENYKYGEIRPIYFDVSTRLLHCEENTYVDIPVGVSQDQNRKNLECLFYEHHRDHNMPEDGLKAMSIEFADSINKHIDIGNTMLEILHVKKSVSLKRYKQIKKAAYDYFNHLEKEFHHINETRRDVQNYLNSMIKKMPGDKKILKRYLSLYNQTKFSNLYISKQGRIEEQTSFVEPEMFLNRSSEQFVSAISPHFPCECMYHKIISYCLVKLLQNEIYRKQLRKCPSCNLFFIAKDSRRKRCYEKNCFREDKKRKSGKTA